MQDEDGATSSCDTVPDAQSTRCLLQSTGFKASSMQTTPSLETKRWTGDEVTIDFAETGDMELAGTKHLVDWDFDGMFIKQANKTYMEITFPIKEGGQVLVNPFMQKVNVFGFTRSSKGLVSSPRNRVWTGPPDAPGSRCVYGIQLTNVPEGIEWKYNFIFLDTPPLVLKYWPEDGRVHRIGTNLFVQLECGDPLFCKDGAFVLDKVKFQPLNIPMPKPEQVVDAINKGLPPPDASDPGVGPPPETPQ